MQVLLGDRKEIVFREMRGFIILNAEDQKSFKEGECQLVHIATDRSLLERDYGIR